MRILFVCCSDPSIFQTRFLRVDIGTALRFREAKPLTLVYALETASEISYGQTVVDIWQMSAKPKNVHVAEKVDVKAFWYMPYPQNPQYSQPNLIILPLVTGK